MKILFLIRHAEALPGRDGPDFDRRLTAAGEHQAAHIAGVLHSRKLTADRVVSSPAIRAWTTARMLAAAWKCAPEKIVGEQTLYLGAAGDYAAVLRKTPPGCHSVALVGHNPVVGGLAAQLSGQRIDRFPPMSVAVFSLETASWEDYEAAPAKLLFVDTPER